jgi:bifunctional DNase/RNase
LIEVKVTGLRYDEKVKSHVVLLREIKGNRILPIWIGPAEASAIGMELVGKKFQRPLTHDLLATVVRGLRASVTKVVISDLRDNTFYANIVLERERDHEIVNVDARPSDSIALALKTNSPIYLSDKVLENAKEVDTSEPGPKAPKEQSEEERAEELRKFLEELDPGDFGKLGP